MTMENLTAYFRDADKSNHTGFRFPVPAPLSASGDMSVLDEEDKDDE